MSLFYATQNIIALLGSKVSTGVNEKTDPTFVITPATLTAAYAGNVSNGAHIGKASQVVLNVQYTAGTNATALGLKFEFSADKARWSNPVNWFQETAESVGTGTTTEYLQERTFSNNGSLVATTVYNLRLTVPIAEVYMRVSAKETLSSGTAFGSVYAELVISGQ